MFDYLFESKAFRNEDQIVKYSLKELSEMVYLIMLTLELLGQTKYSREAHDYSMTTLMYPRFDRIYLSTTDLGNLLSTLLNARQFLDQPDMDIPIQEVKRYLRDFKTRSMSASDRRSFFYKLQMRMKIRDSVLFAFRRDIVDTDDVSFGQRRVLGNRLYQQLRKYEYRVDILAILQKFMDDSHE